MEKINLSLISKNSINSKNTINSNSKNTINTKNRKVRICRVKNLFTVCLFVCLSFLLSNNVFAQPNKPPKVHRSKERMDMIKKLKLLEILELDETTADKFLVKYSFYEKKKEEHYQAMQKAKEELELALQDKSKEVIVEKTNKLVALTEEKHKLFLEKLKDMKSILSETEYAKYLLFDHSFFNNVVGAFVDGHKKIKSKYQNEDDSNEKNIPKKNR